MLMTRYPRTRLIEKWLNEFENGDHDDNTTPLALDVREQENAYVVTTAIPGVNADDIDINLHDDVLTIRAEVAETNHDEGERFIIRERRYGSYSRSLRFRTAVDAENIEADYSNGVLTLNIPKSPEAQPRKINVRSN